MSNTDPQLLLLVHHQLEREIEEMHRVTLARRGRRATPRRTVWAAAAERLRRAADRRPATSAPVCCTA